MTLKQVPQLFANVLRYRDGDTVNTPYGSGIVISNSDGNSHVQVKLSYGAILYAHRSCLVPELRSLEYGEIPKFSKVICLLYSKSNDEERNSCDKPCIFQGTVQAYHILEKTYEVELDMPINVNEFNVKLGDSSRYLFKKEDMRLAIGTRVRTQQFGLGSVQAYRIEDDMYEVSLDTLSKYPVTGYFYSSCILPIDMRLFAKIPSPLTAEQLLKKFGGSISQEDANKLAEKAIASHRRLQQFFEKHAQTISFISTNATYGNQYSQALSALIDPTLADASSSLSTAAQNEMRKLHELAERAKKSLEGELLDGKSSKEFYAQARTVFSQLKQRADVQELRAKLQGKAKTQILETAEQQLLQMTKGDSEPSMLINSSENPQKQKLVIFQALELLEEKLNENVQPQLATFMKDTLSRDNLLSTLQERETDILRAQEKILMLEKFASTQMGVQNFGDFNPSTMLSKAENFLPKVSITAESFLNQSQLYWEKLQQTPQGQKMLAAAKNIISNVNQDPDTIASMMTNAIANFDTTFANISAWSTRITKDSQQRQMFVNDMKNQVLDFFMSVLPSIEVSTISGTEDGLDYSIAGLDLSHFKIRKDKVKVRMGTVADEALLSVRASHLSALLNGFSWTFAQTAFPYLNGSGLADAVLQGGVISMKFSAERVLVNDSWKPQLALHTIEVEIHEDLALTVHGSWFSAVYNMIASVFGELIAVYVAKSIEQKILDRMIKLLGLLNSHVEKYWPLIFQLLDISIDDLPEALPWRGATAIETSPDQIEIELTKRRVLPFVLTKGVLNTHVTVRSVLSDSTYDDDALTPDESESKTLLKIGKTFICDDIPIGAPVVAINGLSCSKLTLEELKELLDKKLPLPITVRFSTIPEVAVKQTREKINSKPKIVTVVIKEEGSLGLKLRKRPLSRTGAIVVGFVAPRNFASSNSNTKGPAERSGLVEIGQLLLKVNSTDVRFLELNDILKILRTTTKRPITLQFAASPDGIIRLKQWPPMIEWEIDESDFSDSAEINQINQLQSSNSGGGSKNDTALTANKFSSKNNIPRESYVVVAAFSRIPSFAQKSGKVLKGDILFEVNGMRMVARHGGYEATLIALEELAAPLCPLHAVFVSEEEYISKKDQEGGLYKTSYTSQREVVFPKAPLGIIFGNWRDEAAYVREFVSNPGPAERTKLIKLGQAILQINGENVPTDATVSTVEEMIAKVITIDESTAGNDPNGPKGFVCPIQNFTLTLRDLDIERELMKIA